jgi:hypothetical protein
MRFMRMYIYIYIYDRCLYADLNTHSHLYIFNALNYMPIEVRSECIRSVGKYETQKN